MKISVSLPDEDVEFLDGYARQQGIVSRSAVLRQAISSLRATQLSDDYADAWREWSDGAEAELWGPTVAAGLNG